ncbi:MAG: hypothetical protein QOJ40_3143 [Verrucomicrobiota bacterium]
MRITNLKTLVGSMLCMGALACISCDDMSRFSRRDAAYYASLAAECDSLLARGPAASIPEARAVARQTNSLPPQLRQLGPSHVQITERSVQLFVGSYNIIWARNQDDEHLWRLSTYREGHGKILYSVRKP